MVNHKNSTLHRLCGKIRFALRDGSLEVGAILLWAPSFYLATLFWAEDEMSHALRTSGDKSKASFLPSRILWFGVRMTDKRKGKKKMKRKNRDEESTKCSQQQSKEQLHSQATWTSGLWVLQEGGQQRPLCLGVSNGTAWTSGCPLPVPTTRLHCSVTLMGRHLFDCWEPFYLASSLSIGAFLCLCHHHRKA